MDRFSRFIVKNLLIFVNLASFIFLFFSGLAPILAHLGFRYQSMIIYRFFTLTSHQRPWRSIHFYDYQMAWDVRMTFIFSAFFFVSLSYLFFKFKPISVRTLLMLIIPMTLDGGIQLFSEYFAALTKTVPFYESTNLRRMLTGTLFGIGLGLLALPQLDTAIKEGVSSNVVISKRSVKSLNMLLGVIFLCFFLYLSFNFFWEQTSKTYRPSGLIDNASRVPGVNYEVTDSGWHSPSPRDTGYWRRARDLAESLNNKR